MAFVAPILMNGQFVAQRIPRLTNLFLTDE